MPNIQNLNNLKNYLPKNYPLKVQVALFKEKDLTVSKSLISMVANGERENIDILEKLIEIASNHKKRIEIIKKKIKTL